MWEVIRANARRSRLLLGIMGFLLVGLGGLVGGAVSWPDGIGFGAIAALLVWFAQLMLVMRGGDRMILMSAGAREIQKQDYPVLWNVAEEMTIAAGMGKMPRMFVIDDPAPNAFATGRDPESASVAVTTGLLKRLNRDELQGVVAHEIGHIRNHDVRFMTTALVMVGTIVILSDLFLRFIWYGGGRRGQSRGNAQLQILMMVGAMVAAVLAPIAAQALYFACSRQREYLADATAARFTRYPEGLASALEKISSRLARTKESSLRALAPLYIVSPLQARGASGLFSSHPPVNKRVEVLRNMGGGAGWAEYEKAYRSVLGANKACLDRDVLKQADIIPIRQATAVADAQQDAVDRAREVGDLLDRLVNFLLIPCICGVRIKVPPEMTRETVECTRCGRTHPVPQATPAGATVAMGSGAAAATGSAAADGGSSAASQTLVYQRKLDGWESFRCACGKVHQLSPALRVSQLRCKACRRRIDVREAG